MLEGYHPFSLADQCISLDLMVDIEQVTGHRIKLESVAAASLGTGKTAQRLDAIRWWRETSVQMQVQKLGGAKTLDIPPLPL